MMGKENNQPRLIMVTGLPGTGKTTFAKALAQHLNAQHLNTDILRTEMELRGQYDNEVKSKVYEALQHKTQQFLKEGISVVVDGTFYRLELRQPYNKLAKHTGIPIHWLLITAPEALIRERVSKKRKYSEADFEVYQKIKNSWEPFKSKVLKINSTAISLMIQQAEIHFQQ